MMRCSKVESKLTDYIDDLVTARQREAIDRHLFQCDACREALEDIHAATGALQALGRVRAPASFAPRVNSTVRELAPKALAPALFGHRMRLIAGMASFALAVVVLTGWHASRTSPYVIHSPGPAVSLPAMVATAPEVVVEEPASAALEAIETPQPEPTRVAAAPAPRRARRATRSAPNRATSRPAVEPVDVTPEPAAPVAEAAVAVVALSEADPGLWDRWETPQTYQLDGRHIPPVSASAERTPEVRMVSTPTPMEPVAEASAAAPEPAILNPFLTDALSTVELSEV